MLLKKERQPFWTNVVFDFMGEEQKAKYQDAYPDIGEYTNEEILSFEKEVLGIYISGHLLRVTGITRKEHYCNISGLYAG